MQEKYPLLNLKIESLANTYHEEPDVNNLFTNEERLRLGQLADVAEQIARMQRNRRPEFHVPHLLLLAADHGVILTHRDTQSGERTCDRVTEIARGRQFINVLCRQHNFATRIIDCGMQEQLPPALSVTTMRIGDGTANYFDGFAMTKEQCTRAIEYGRQLALKAHEQGSNVMAVGLVARGARIASALTANALANVALKDSLSREQIAIWSNGKWTADDLEKLSALRPKNLHPLDVLSLYGGFEMAFAVGALLQGAHHRMTMLIDCFPMLCAALIAHALEPNVTDYIMLTQIEQLTAMEQIAKQIRVTPILRLGLYASESVGALLAYPIIQAALRLLSLPGSQVSR